MAKHELLDNVTHKNLRVITDRSAWYGDDVAATLAFPIEFRRLQTEYPIAFQKNEEKGGFEPIVVFGFSEGENLFLGADGWDAGYVPLSIERQPFLIGFAPSDDGGEDAPVVHVDMDSSRISETDGEPVFLEHGGQSPYLEHINSVLNAIHEGYGHNTQLSAALTAYDLIEPFMLEFDTNGEKTKLSGLYTINEEKLRTLDGAALEKLNRAGFLESIYMVLASIANFRVLIDKKAKQA